MYDKLIFEISQPNRQAYSLPETEISGVDLPASLKGNCHWICRKYRS